MYFAIRESAIAAAQIEDAIKSGSWDSASAFGEYMKEADRGQQVIQDLIDFFWEFPLAFQRMAHKTHREDIIDCFAGSRIYGDEPPAAINKIRTALCQLRQRKFPKTTRREAVGPGNSAGH